MRRRLLPTISWRLMRPSGTSVVTSTRHVSSIRKRDTLHSGSTATVLVGFSRSIAGGLCSGSILSGVGRCGSGSPR
eukprot:3984078-Prymnesium_polylepis.1